jgi:hypothetical protein
VNIPVQFFEPGSHVVSAAVKSTGLTTDDRLDYSVDVLDWPQVLLVSSAPATTQPVSPLGMALTAVSRKGVEPAVVTMASPADLTADRLKPMNVVMLDDVAQLSSEQMKLLQQFEKKSGLPKWQHAGSADPAATDFSGEDPASRDRELRSAKPDFSLRRRPSRSIRQDPDPAIFPHRRSHQRPENSREIRNE